MTNEDLMMALATYFLKEFPSDKPEFIKANLGMEKGTLIMKVKKTISELENMEIVEILEEYKNAFTELRRMKPSDYEDFLFEMEASFNFSNV